MDNKKKFNTNRLAAYALSGVMLASVVPYNVFANEDKVVEAANQTIELKMINLSMHLKMEKQE